MIDGVGFSRLEHYLRCPIPHLSGVILVIHMAVGCCWHHAHVCAANCCDAPSTLAEADPCHGHRGEDDRTQRLSQPTSDQHECDGGACVFLNAGSLRLLERYAAEFLTQPVACRLASSTLPQPTWLEAACPLLARGGDSPRPHLLYQVLLL